MTRSPQQLTPRNYDPPAVISPLFATAGAVALVWGCWRALVDTQRGQVLDELALRGSNIGAWRLDSQLLTLLESVSLQAIAGTMLVVFLLALLRKQWLTGVVAAVVVAGANVTTQILKYWVFSRPALVPAGTGMPDANTLPSGHTTVAASAAVALLLVVPVVLRPLMALVGAAGITAFGYATLINQWHRPSDVLAAVCVAAAWGFAGILVLRLTSRAHHRNTGRSGPGAMFVALLLMGLVGLGGAAAAGYVLWNVDLATATRTQQFLAYAGGAAALEGLSAGAMGITLAFLQTMRPTLSPAAQPAPATRG